MMTLTDAAKDRVRSLINDETGESLRVFTEGGGCSGMTYGMAFDEAREGDEVLEEDGFRIVIAADSKPLMDGVTMDFEDNGMEQGFRFANPNSSGGCGCGQSFTA